MANGEPSPRWSASTYGVCAATASSAASRMAGLTTANQPAVSSASTPTIPAIQAPSRSGSTGVCTSVPLAPTVVDAGLLGLDAERQRPSAALPLALVGVHAGPHERRATGLDTGGRRLEVGLQAARRIDEAHPAAGLDVAPVLQRQLVGGTQPAALGRLEQRQAAVVAPPARRG